MDNKEDIVKQFAKYCSKCDGQCCKRGVFSVFDWEMEKLSKEHENIHQCRISDTRGTSKDIAIDRLCQFSTGHGCKLRIDLRPTDCLTYPFYPKKIKGAGDFKIDSFVIDSECFFSEEIAKDKKLLGAVKKYWKSIGKNVTDQEITDWIGNEGNWNEWYKNTIEIEHKRK